MVDLILHIGSHKTATTSLQHFCVKNAELLAEHGFYYPSPTNSAYTHNNLAANIVFDRVQATARYLRNIAEDASSAGQQTVVLSGESFFAMTCFFLDFYDRKRPHKDYFKTEDMLINQLKDMCSHFDTVKIVCYLRPQESFAGSLYNQLVKATNGTYLPYDACLEKIKHCFDYKGHLDLWAKAFGKKNLYVFNFEDHKDNILKHFCDKLLTPQCYRAARHKDFLSNTRLNRDVLEAKRIFNYTTPDPALAYVSARVFKNLNESYPDKKGWQIFAPVSAQETFFSAFKKGNSALAKTFAHMEIPTLKSKGDPTYPGLSDEKRDEILARALKGLRTPHHRFEIGARRFINNIQNASPVLKTPLQVLRKWIYSLRLHIKGW